jgi:hypothetical protein
MASAMIVAIYYNTLYSIAKEELSIVGTEKKKSTWKEYQPPVPFFLSKVNLSDK